MKSSAFTSAPLFRIALCVVLGIVLAESCGLLLATLVAALPLLALLLCFDKRLAAPRMETVFAVLVYTTAIGLGAAYRAGTTWKADAGLAVENCTTVQLAGVIASKPKSNDRGVKAWIEVYGYVREGQFYRVSEKVQLYTDGKTAFSKYDTVFVTASLRDVWSRYPGYMAYLQRNGIRFSAYAESVARGGQCHGFAYRLEAMQHHLAAAFTAHIPDKEAAGIAVAMFLGDTDHLDRDLRNDFAAAGLSHVLAISGMHIAAMFLLLGYLFQLLPIHNRLKHALVLAVLLAYMLLTGASPSVVRAVIMFGTLLLAKIFYLRHSTLNLLGFSALLQILCDTDVVFQVGFQLSYAAVAGIVLVYPLFERWANTPYPILNHLYSWIGVTLTAQLFTTPIILLTFGQFPTYFLAANVCTALLGTACTFVGFIALAFAYVPGLNVVLGYLCYLLLKALALTASWFAALPHAVLTRCDFAQPGMYVLVLQLLAAVLLILLPKGVASLRARLRPVHGYSVMAQPHVGEDARG